MPPELFELLQKYLCCISDHWSDPRDFHECVALFGFQIISCFYFFIQSFVCLAFFPVPLFNIFKMGIEDRRRALIGKALLTSSDLFLLLFSNADTQQQPSVLLQDTNNKVWKKRNLYVVWKGISNYYFFKETTFFSDFFKVNYSSHKRVTL